MRKTTLALALALIACAAPALAGLYPTVLTGSASITVKPGDDVLVALAQNQTTGFSWEVVGSGKSVLSLEGSAIRPPASAALGAGGEKMFAFKAQQSGSATVEIAYRRPWEKHVKPARVVTITVTVTK